MPKGRSPIVVKERSPLPQRHDPIASASLDISASNHTHQPIPSVDPVPGEVPILPQPTYSQTILQPPILATSPSVLPQQIVAAGSPSSQSRRLSTSSMRNASMSYENVAPSSTPTGRISKAKKGKRVHACEYPGCGKVFTRAEHKRRHELNHNPEAIFQCPLPGCGKSFHRIDLLQRHQERHDIEASPSLNPPTPRLNSNFTAPPSVLASSTTISPPQRSEAAPRTPFTIKSIVHPPLPHTSHHRPADQSLEPRFEYMPADATTYGDGYYYGSERSHSPVSDIYNHYHRQSISSASSVIGIDPQISPMMTTSMLGQWTPETAPPVALPPATFDEGSAPYITSPTVTSLPVPLHELDGHEYAAIQRELSTVPGLIFQSNGNTIRWDCLDHYWQYFHPSFPIVHKPTFLPAKPSPLLASAVLAIGSYYDTRPDAKLYSLALQESAMKLLRRRTNIAARSRIADLQTVLLLEILSKFCARQISAQTSSRFRSLFASLYQSQQWLSTSPLAVHKAQSSKARSPDDLKRAHKFWVEHETRRRIFHACSVLDAQQVCLFEQRATIVSHNKMHVHDIKGTVQLPCDEELWEASTIDEWSLKAERHVGQDLNEARTSYQNASVGDYSFFQHQIINANASAAQRCSEEIESPPPSTGALVSKTRFNYHVFQMAKHIPIRNLLIVAGESWLLGRKVEQEAEYIQAKHVMREWVNQAIPPITKNHIPDILHAHWHALKVLRMVVDPTEGPYAFRSTNMLHEDWSIYLAILVCWAHGYECRTRPQTSTPTTSFPRTISPSTSRKRKNDKDNTQPRKRSALIPTFSNISPTPALAAHPEQPPFIPPSTSYIDMTFPTYTNNPWITNPYYTTTPPLTAPYSTQTVDSISVLSTIPSTTTTTTASSTPLSMLSAPTSIPYSKPTLHRATSSAMQDLKIYLTQTDVPSPLALTTLDPAILAQTTGLLETIRINKFGKKGIVGGLMNDAERVLKRLSEGRGGDMF